MSADCGHIAGWIFAILAIFVFANVMRDLLIIREEQRMRDVERMRGNNGFEDE